MPSVKDLFPSKFIAAGDLKNQDQLVTIEKVVVEDINGEEEKKPVAYFAGVPKGMVLNKTNAMRIAELHGNDTDSWAGKTITIYPTETAFRGDMVECIRIRKSAPQKQPAETSSVF